jgi:hypothetical protein
MSADTNAKCPGALSRPKQPGGTRYLLIAGASLLGGAIVVAAASWGGGRPDLMEVIDFVMLGLILLGCLWLLRNRVRSALIWLLALGLACFAPGVVSEVSVQVLGGEQALSLGQLLRFVLTGRLDIRPTGDRAAGGVTEGQLQRRVNKGANLDE